MQQAVAKSKAKGGAHELFGGCGVSGGEQLGLSKQLQYTRSFRGAQVRCLALRVSIRTRSRVV
jgi:hypothetical protein